jgi:precorrin-2 dehydrogenase/sirohydrochlorin ferrochelatase
MRGLMIYRLLEGQLAVVVGGGSVAARKVSQLIQAGARVRIVSPEIRPDIQADEYVRRPFADDDLAGAALVFVATDNAQVNHEVAQQARAVGVLVNVADDPEYCDFFLPAVAHRGEMTLAVSTGGSCPGFASLVRQKLESFFGNEWALALRVVAASRAWSRTRGLPWTQLLSDELLQACAGRDRSAIDKLLARELGADVTLESLAVDWS